MSLTNRTLILFKYFWETTDEAHPVSLADISAHLKEHGIAADPRTCTASHDEFEGVRYTVKIGRAVKYLYREGQRWYVDRSP